MCDALSEILGMTYEALLRNDSAVAVTIEPLEQVIDILKDALRDRHVKRLQNGECNMEAGFIWSDLLTDMERTSDHCSNIALCIIDAGEHNMNAHQRIRSMKKNDPAFFERLEIFSEKYRLPQL